MQNEQIVHGIRQGDVVLVARDTPAAVEAATAVQRDARGRVVLQEGEVTGHAHAVLDPEARYLETSTAASVERWLLTGSSSQVVHEEHAPHTLNPNTLYEQWYQFEYAPDELRLVAD